MKLNSRIKRILLVLFGLFLSIQVYFLVPSEPFSQAPAVATMIVFMAFLWVTELIPLAITSLIPIVFLPAISVGTLSEITSFYARPIIYLFLGGFILAIGIQKTGLHKRIALFLLHKIGDNHISWY